MKIVCTNGILSVVNSSGETVFTDIGCSLQSDDKIIAVNDGWILSPDGESAVSENGDARLSFNTEDGKAFFRATVINNGERIETTKQIQIAFKSERPIKEVKGSVPLTYNGNYCNAMGSIFKLEDFAVNTGFDAGDNAVIMFADGALAVAGFVTFGRYFGTIYTQPDGTICARQRTESHPLESGASVTSDEFCILKCTDPADTLQEYAELILSKSGADRRWERYDVPTGYCTWYYYYQNVTADTILDSARDMAKYRDRLPVKYIQIDDGWWTHWGDWEANEKFPEGMKALADSIRAEGFVPGIWLAPFGADKDSKLFKEHPECFIRDFGSDEPRVGAWGYYNIDYSVPYAREFLKKLIRTVTYDWGYEYLKLDIISDTIGPYKHSDPDFTAIKNYHEGMKIVNENVPDGTFILGCTVPLGHSVGYVDGVRVSCDIVGTWESLCNTFSAVLNRFFYHKHVFINDADCLIIRKSDGEDDECRLKCERNDTEIRSFISAAAASGGTIMFSDKMSLLTEQQIKMLSFLFPIIGDSARPLDLMEGDIPGVLDMGIHGSLRTVILINWSDNEKEMSFKCGNCHAFEFWSQKYDGTVNGEYRTKIEAHGCRVVTLADAASTAAVVGCDDMLVPVTEYSCEDGLLKTEFTKCGETLYIAASYVHSENCRCVKVKDGLYALTDTGNKYISATVI